MTADRKTLNRRRWFRTLEAFVSRKEIIEACGLEFGFIV
jgi:hypothetical protein